MPFSIDLIPLLEYAARSQLFKFIASIPTEMATDTISELYQYAEPTIVVAKQFTFTKLTIIDSTYFDCWFTNYYRVYYPRPVPVIIIIEEPKTWQSELLYYCSNWYFLAAVLSIIVIGLISLILYYYRGARIVVAARLRITGILNSVGNAITEAQMIFNGTVNSYLWSSICSTAFILGLIYITDSISWLCSVWINSVAFTSICNTLFYYWTSPSDLISTTEIFWIITFIYVCFLVQAIISLAIGCFAGDAANIVVVAELELEPLVVNVVEADADIAIAPLDLEQLVVNVVEPAAGIIIVEAELEIEIIAPDVVEAAAEIVIDAELVLDLNEERPVQDEAVLEINLDAEKDDLLGLALEQLELPAKSATYTSQSTNAAASTSAVKLDATTPDTTSTDLVNTLLTGSTDQEVVEIATGNNVDDSSESTSITIELPSKSTSYATEFINATASTSAVKIDEFIPITAFAGMNTTQQSDSPVEDVNETLPQPRPLPTIAAGASTSIISGAADSSNDEIVASDLIEPAANNLPQPIITNQEYLQTSFVDSTSTAAWPCFAESLALRERTISHESMDSGYQSSSPNEASTSTFTTSHAIWTAELPILPPLATKAQGSFTTDSAPKELDLQQEVPSRNLMGPFKDTINTLLTTPLPTFNFLPIVGNIQNSLQQIQEDLSKSEPTSLPGEYNFDDTYTDEEISKALIESGKAAIEIGKAGIEIGKVGIEVGIEVGTVLIGAGIVFGKAGIGAGIGAGNAAIEVGKAGIVWFNVLKPSIKAVVNGMENFVEDQAAKARKTFVKKTSIAKTKSRNPAKRPTAKRPVKPTPPKAPEPLAEIVDEPVEEIISPSVQHGSDGISMEFGQRIMRDLGNQDRAKVFKEHGARVDAVRESRIERGLDPNQYQAGDEILFYEGSKLEKAQHEEWLNANGF